MAENNRISSQSLKSQQSIDSANAEVFLPSDADAIIQEEDLQSELDCPGGECQINFSRMSVTLSNGQPEEAKVTIVEMHGDVVPTPLSEVVPEQEQHQPVQQEQILVPKPEVEQEVQPQAEVQNCQSMVSTGTESVGHPRPVSLVSRGRQSTEERKSVESPSGQLAEEKVFAQIRAKKTVANLIAKFNTGAEEPAKENQNGVKNKEGAGAVNIQAMRQKFSQQ